MLYELVNMSDPYTFRADSVECAAIVTVLLGHGQYLAKPLEDDNAEGVPFFMSNGSCDEWFLKNTGRDVSESRDLLIGERAPELVAALRSVLIGRPHEREECESVLALIPESERGPWLATRHERRRSSMNNIGARALKIAEQIEAKSGEPLPAAPAQVFVR